VSRFVRVPSSSVCGLKLANRLDVNKALSYTQASDVNRFAALLRRAFGAPDTNSDATYSYGVHDNDTGVTVRAYSAQSGPAYGGMPDDCFEDYAGGRYVLKPEVARTLAELDTWLEQQP
jgi:hypothetical protein